MNNLIRNVLWSALILVWGCYFGAGFIVQRSRSYAFSYREQFIMGLIATAIILVGAAILTYRFARRHKSADPMKGALIVCTLLGLILAALFAIEPYLPNWL